MAAVIRIKRSTGTAAPGTLKTGEIAYSYGTGNENNLGDRLFFGKGDDGNGDATSVVVIGGEYFANMLDHAHGTLTANSAIIVDSASKIDIINIDNIQINGNTISSTNTDGNIVLDPNGNGSVDVNTSKIINVTDPTSNQDAATKLYVDTVAGAKYLTFVGDTGSDTVNLSDSSFDVAGGTGISTVVTDNQVTINLDNSGVSANTYGSSTLIPVLTINDQGQVTSATTASLATTLNVAGDTGTGSVSLLDSSLSITTGSGIVSTASGNGFKLTLDSDASVKFGTMEIINGLTIGGDLQVNGTTVTVNTTTLEVTDNMIYLNAGESDGSPTQSIDVGFAANVNDDGSYEHVGFFRDATDNVWKLYQGYTPEPDSSPQIDTSHPSFAYAPLRVSTITGVYAGFDSDFSGKSTTDLTEGNNLYYTTARADSDAKHALSSGDGIAYDVDTGIIATDDTTIDHDALNNFVANEHINHTSVTLTAGRGLTGGGDISASRSFAIDSAELADYHLANQFLAGDGIDISLDANQLTIAGTEATVTALGIASFDSDQFTVSSGAVTISVIDGGTF